MKRIICCSILIILIISVLAFSVGCCPIFENITNWISNDNNDGTGETTNFDNKGETAEERTENIRPIAVLEVYQQSSGSDYFAVGNPVYFSAADSSDADGDILNFQWQIGDTVISDGGETSYIFNSTGEYVIVLTASDGSNTVTVSKRFTW